MNECYVDVMGGLGNQLFQIAAGYAYCKKYDKKLYINPNNWVAGQGTNVLLYKDTIFKNFEYGSPVTRDVVSYHEKRFDYDEIPQMHGSIALRGYFQSLKYFEDVKDEFISLLNLPNTKTIDDGSGRKNVAFHIRRGDYVKYKNIHFVCHTEYFKNFFEMFKDCKILVFTDSPENILEEFSGYDFDIIKSSSDINEFAYMSKCDIIVGSNSTFSWWASLIGGKECYFPSKWFADGRSHGDIYRKDMKLKDV